MTDGVTQEPDEPGIRAALEAILSSRAFADANRLKSFLTYIVEEFIGGRGSEIRAKLIASDVYGRRPEDGSEQEAIVRVDAGRLRRRLDAYYADEGSRDPVRIFVLSGGYVPTFELRDLVEADTPPDVIETRSSGLTKVAVAVLLSGCLGFGLGWFGKDSTVETTQTSIPPDDRTSANPQGDVRRSVNRVSSASLLARTFVEEANGLIFPSIDPARLRAAEILCQRAIELGPALSGGHACNGFVQAYMSFVARDDDTREVRATNAKQATDMALSIDPANGYAQMSSAWRMFVKGERETAIEQAELALDIAPTETFLQNIYGMMLVFDGQGARLTSSDPVSKDPGARELQVHPFVLAGARLQSGDYDGTVQAVEDAILLEGRTSALISAIYVAALEKSGNQRRAEDFARNLTRTWQPSNFEASLSRLFSSGTDVESILGPLSAVLARIRED